MSYEVLARRWRPLTFDAVVGQAPIVRTLRNALARGRIAHAYLFAGPRGVGKTTTARLLAMGLNCARAGAREPVPCAACEPCREIVAGRALDVIEIDGASNRGIDEVRALRENARYAPARGRRKVYIIDEVHMLTEPAFNALLKTLEEPPAHVVFVLATTEPRRLPPTILSRCQRFDFRPIPAAEIAASLQRVLAGEARSPGAPAVAVEPEALRLIARAADGSLRDALSLLDAALAYGEGQVTAATVRELLGSGGAEAAWGLAEVLVRREAGEALRRIDAAAAEGLDLGVLALETLEVLRRALLAVLLPEPPADVLPEEVERLRALGSAGAEDLLLLVKGLLDAEAEMRRSLHPRLDLEVAAVRLCHRPRGEAIETLLERLEQAEAALRGYAGPPVTPPEPAQADLLAGPAAEPPAPPELAPRPGVPGRPLTPPARPPASPSRTAASPPRAAGVRPPAAASPRGAAAAPPAPAASGTPGASPPEGLGGSPRGRIAEAWPRIVTEVTRVRPTFGHLLGEAEVAAEEGRITVAVVNGNAFTQDQLQDRANRQLLLDAARRVLDEVCDIVLTVRPPGGGAGPLAAHPVVRAAVELFDGEVIAVRPLHPGSPTGGGGASDAVPEGGEA